MHCKGFLETWLTFEVPTPLIPLLFSVVLCVCLLVVQGKIRLWEVREKSITRVSLCYILKHLEDRKAWPVLIYYTWCDFILIFKLHRRTRLTPRSSIHSLKIRMTSHPCNKYEQIMLSYLLIVKYSIFLRYQLKYQFLNQKLRSRNPQKRAKNKVSIER